MASKRRAVIYARSLQHRTDCINWCAKAGYQVAGVASDPDSAQTMVTEGRADVIVVARRQHLCHLTPPAAVAGDPERPRDDDHRRPRIHPPAGG